LIFAFAKRWGDAGEDTEWLKGVKPKLLKIGAATFALKQFLAPEGQRIFGGTRPRSDEDDQR